MDLFKLVGSIFIKNADANDQIDGTKKKAEDLATVVGKSFQTAGDKITKVGKALAPVSAVVGGALGASVKGASDFNDSMAKMSTLFDTTQTSVSDLSKEFLSLSKKTGLSATELAEAGYQALSAGQSVEDVAGFVETAGNLAKAGFTSTTTAVDVLTTAMNAYGEQAGTAEEISNKLVRTQNLGKTTVDELASSMGKIIPTASSMGVNIDNLTSGYVSLTKQGIATAEATTYMNSMLNELGDSGTDLGGIIKDKTGKSFQDLMNEGYSLADVLKITKDYADENNIAYNELWGSAEAGKAGLAILNGGVEEFNGTVETMADKTDDVGQALEKLNTPSAKVRKAITQVKDSGIELGTSFMTALLPTLEKVVGGVEKATQWFSSLDEGTKTTIATVMALIAGLSPVLIIGGKIISGIGSFIAYIPTIKAGITALSGGFKALWGILSANPIILVIAVIAGLVAGFIHLWNTSESFRNFWINLWNTIKSTVSKAINAVKSAVNAGMSAVRSVVSTVMNTIRNTFNTVWNAIKSTVTSVINGVRNTISSGLHSAYSTVSSVLGNIKSKFKSILDGAKSIVSDGIEAIKSKFNFSWSLPHLKLPHFSVSGEFSLNPPSIPHFSVDWYKKAMDKGAMFTEPTIFAYNPVTGTAKGAGEAGDEVMLGKRTMLGWMQEAVGIEIGKMSDGLIRILERIYGLLSQYIPDLPNYKVVMDSGVLVGELAPQMDSELGKRIKFKGRGN